MRITHGLTILATILALAIASPALAVIVTGGASLSGSEVVPAVATEAFGPQRFRTVPGRPPRRSKTRDNTLAPLRFD